MTLAPETGEVSRACMGLRRVLLFAKVLLVLVEVPGSPVWLGRSSRRGWALRSFLGRLGMNRLQVAARSAAAGRHAASRHATSWELAPPRISFPRSGRCSAPVASLIISTSESSSPQLPKSLHRNDVSHQLLPRSAVATVAVAHDTEVGGRSVGGYPLNPEALEGFPHS
jgi:hypothetical protein